MVEKISAVTLRVAIMEASVRFYKDVLGLEIIYGGESSYFTSLRTKDGDTILNLEHGNAGIRWGRLIFHVSDVAILQKIAVRYAENLIVHQSRRSRCRCVLAKRRDLNFQTFHSGKTPYAAPRHPRVTSWSWRFLPSPGYCRSW